MNDELPNGFNRTIIGVTNTEKLLADSRILEMKCFYPKKGNVCHVAVDEKIEKTEVNRLENRIKTDTLKSNDIQESVRIGDTVTEIFEGVF